MGGRKREGGYWGNAVTPFSSGKVWQIEKNEIGGQRTEKKSKVNLPEQNI